MLTPAAPPPPQPSCAGNELPQPFGRWGPASERAATILCVLCTALCIMYATRVPAAPFQERWQQAVDKLCATLGECLHHTLYRRPGALLSGSRCRRPGQRLPPPTHTPPCLCQNPLAPRAPQPRPNASTRRSSSHPAPAASWQLSQFVLTCRVHTNRHKSSHVAHHIANRSRRLNANAQRRFRAPSPPSAAPNLAGA